MRWVRRLIGVALVIAVMVGGWQLAAGNATRVAVNYLYGMIDLPLWQALGMSFAAGLVLAALLAFLFGLRSGMERRRYRKEVRRLESEVHELRNLPLNPDAIPGNVPGGEPGAGSAQRSG